MTDARNNSILYGYDLCGRRTTVTDARNNTVTTAYDKVGNVLSVTDAKGNVILSKTYNNRNLPATITDANGTRTYTYNALGKPVSVTDAIGTKQFAYDNMGRNTQVTDEAEGVSSTVFNKLGNPTALTGPGGASTAYTYDNVGRMTSKTTPSGGTVTYSNFHYTGKPMQMVDARGNVHQYSYNVRGQILSHSAPYFNESYTYDLEGNLLTSSAGSHTVTRTYDELNRMTSYAEGDIGTLYYTYDSVGNIADMTGPYTVIYAYDANNNLISAIDWSHGVTVSYTYDENNKLSTETKPDGSVTTYTYDAFQRLASKIARKANQEMIIGYEYTYDARGRLATEKDLVKNKMMCYTYDNRDWVTNRRTVDLATEEYTDDPFTYDAAGNLQNLIGDDTPTYDINNRLTEYNGVSLHYDAEGNLLYHLLPDLSNPAYTYDAKNRLASDQVEFSATYNADNVRYRMTDRDEINLYDYTCLYDTNCRLNRVLFRRDNFNTANVAYYLYGLGLVGECKYDDLDFKTYHFDYRGSTVAITDNTGNITDTFEYDTYGKQTARTGSTDTPFRYNGRDGVMTEYNGLLYMRARYYNPDMRRFISADILPGGIDNAVTLNRYAYANANPVTNIDPFGLCAERGQINNIFDLFSDFTNNQGDYDQLLEAIISFMMEHKNLFIDPELSEFKVPIGSNAYISYSFDYSPEIRKSRLNDIRLDHIDQLETLSYPSNVTPSFILNGDGSVGMSFYYDVNRRTGIKTAISGIVGHSLQADYTISTKDVRNNVVSSTFSLKIINQNNPSNKPPYVCEEERERVVDWRKVGETFGAVALTGLAAAAVVETVATLGAGAWNDFIAVSAAASAWGKVLAG